MEKEERGGAEARRESERGKSKEEGLNEDTECVTPRISAEYHSDLITGHKAHVLGY